MSINRKWTEELPVTLTQDEFVERSTELAHALKEVERLEYEAAENRKSWKQRIEDKQENIKRLTEIVKDRAESRPVDCYEIKNIKTRMMESVRTDNGEIYRSRPLSETELEEQDMFEEHE